MKRYGIEDIGTKPQDVTKIIIKELRKGSFLSTATISKPIVNIDTGKRIEIWASGIHETIGKGKYYKAQSDTIKRAKIAAIEALPKIIKYGDILKVNDKSKEGNKEVTFTLLVAPLVVDGYPYSCEVVIKQTDAGNRFYIHKMDIVKENKDSEPCPRSKMENKNKLCPPPSKIYYHIQM